jgi:hypothetical protein
MFDDDFFAPFVLNVFVWWLFGPAVGVGVVTVPGLAIRSIAASLWAGVRCA